MSNSPCSKVHISKATMDALQGTFCVEPANGWSRSNILENQKVETFFITSRNTVMASEDRFLGLMLPTFFLLIYI